MGERRWGDSDSSDDEVPYVPQAATNASITKNESPDPSKSASSSSGRKGIHETVGDSGSYSRQTRPSPSTGQHKHEVQSWQHKQLQRPPSTNRPRGDDRRNAGGRGKKNDWKQMAKQASRFSASDADGKQGSSDDPLDGSAWMARRHAKMEEHAKERHKRQEDQKKLEQEDKRRRRKSQLDALKAAMNEIKESQVPATDGSGMSSLQRAAAASGDVRTGRIGPEKMQDSSASVGYPKQLLTRSTQAHAANSVAGDAPNKEVRGVTKSLDSALLASKDPPAQGGTKGYRNRELQPDGSVKFSKAASRFDGDGSQSLGEGPGQESRAGQGRGRGRSGRHRRGRGRGHGRGRDHGHGKSAGPQATTESDSSVSFDPSGSKSPSPKSHQLSHRNNGGGRGRGSSASRGGGRNQHDRRNQGRHSRKTDEKGKGESHAPLHSHTIGKT